MTDLQRQLFALADPKYKAFHSKLIPNVAPETIIGVRTPVLRSFAKELFAKGLRDYTEFMQTLPHEYYDENNLHGFLIEKIGDYDETVAALDRFLPYVDNWATCDLMSPKCFAKHLPELEKQLGVWMQSDRLYTVRFAINMLMRWFLGDRFKTEQAEAVAEAAVRFDSADGYYMKMAVAWYFATALAKQYDAVLPFLTGSKLDTWTHNKTIQKAVESYRINADTKTYLRTLNLRGTACQK